MRFAVGMVGECQPRSISPKYFASMRVMRWATCSSVSPRSLRASRTASTAHSAKGLQWDAVHLISVYDGNFPADMSTATEEQVDEERRLLYVALTRPRRRLHVYVPVRYYHRPRGGDDSHGYGQASRFLTEAVQSLFNVTRTAEAQTQLAQAALPRRRIDVSVDALFG
jgi:ATP-dependent DNA helicase UvrD/PcrA